MKESVVIAALSCFAVGAGFLFGNSFGSQTEQRRLGSAVCKHLSGKFSLLDNEPVCVMPVGIMRFYEKD